MGDGLWSDCLCREPRRALFISCSCQVRSGRMSASAQCAVEPEKGKPSKRMPTCSGEPSFGVTHSTHKNSGNCTQSGRSCQRDAPRLSHKRWMPAMPRYGGHESANGAPRFGTPGPIWYDRARRRTRADAAPAGTPVAAARFLPGRPERDPCQRHRLIPTTHNPKTEPRRGRRSTCACCSSAMLKRCTTATATSSARTPG